MRGIPVGGVLSGRKLRRISVVAAQIGKLIVAPMQYDGTMNSAQFEFWFEKALLPELPKNTTIVMDNATFHRKTTLLPIARQAGHNLIFLPPYSPELNPIEKFWGWLKRYLQKILHHFDSFDDAFCSAFNVC